MAEMTVYDTVSVKLQFRTSLPVDDAHREDRRQEFAAMLHQLRDVVRAGLKEIQAEGWEAVVTETGR